MPDTPAASPGNAPAGATTLPQADPDLHEYGAVLDNIVPTFGYQLTPMVGLGGSAGSIQALQAFFGSMPPDSGMVFVVILHLSPDHSSVLPAMIQKWTKMPVLQPESLQKAEPNHVYVIPPGKHLTATDGHLRLDELDREHGRRVAVDLFFRSLADTHGPHAAAIVLSGADSDGRLGVKRIKERGGLTIAQDPDEAEHDSMPRMAINSGMVDWVLPVAQMPARIVDYFAREGRLELPAEDGPAPGGSPKAARSESESAFHEILMFLRARTGRDFSYYKRATIVRRISRRMQVNAVENLLSYLGFLRTHPGEAGALLKDLLISVTNFFRDRDAFAALERHIPELFAGKKQTDSVRVWCPACATGEEAYSIAMLLSEHAQTLESPPTLQVFGCDLDEDAVQCARAGIFHEAISADVSEERLKRFFVKEHRGYRVRRELREMVLFASHDLLKDAPFSRLDLISCRHLLIYLNRDAQSRVLDIFHFALRHEGLLFLGSAESVDEGSPLFRVIDKKHRIYARRSAQRIGIPVPSGPSMLLVRQIEQQAMRSQELHTRAVPAGQLSSGSSSPPAKLPEREEGISWSELHFKLLERFGPPSVLINRDGEIQHISESAGRFLQLGGGAPTTNLLRLVHPALRVELRTLLFRAAETGEMAEAVMLPFEMEGVSRAVDIQVAPATDLAPDFLLVTFALKSSLPPTEAAPAEAPQEQILHHLERELEQVKGRLRDTIEQYEASTEELKANNEELQAMNEELRSATEELETSREELQSINEELTTVNQESKTKVEELAHANSDLQNLMGATAIATIFLDREMRIMRFTASAVPIFNLIHSDVGRPLSDLQRGIEYPEIGHDAQRVLENLLPVEREVHAKNGSCYIARMLPYRTQEDRIAGVVLTFVDITELQRSKTEVEARNAELERFNQAAVGRELRMVALKREVNELSARLGEPPRYSLDFEKEAG